MVRHIWVLIEDDTPEEPEEITNPNQHCTSRECPYTMSHTMKWCGYSQPRQCDCHWCYPERGQR